MGVLDPGCPAGTQDLCQSAPVLMGAMGKFSATNEASPSEELCLYSIFHTDLVCGDFIHSLNSCVGFKVYSLGKDFGL